MTEWMNWKEKGNTEYMQTPKAESHTVASVTSSAAGYWDQQKNTLNIIKWR